MRACKMYQQPIKTSIFFLSHVRKILKARLTILCDEGRSHPQVMHHRLPMSILPSFNNARFGFLYRKTVIMTDLSYPVVQYWALKKERDRLDGGEDDSDVVQSWADNQISGVDDDVDMSDDFSTNWDDDFSSY